MEKKLVVVAGSYDGSLHGWGNVEDKTLNLEFAFKAHLGCLKVACVSNSEAKFNIQGNRKRFLATGGTDEAVHVFDLEKKEQIGTLVEHTDTVLSLCFVGNLYLLSGGKDGNLCLWRCTDWNLISHLKGHKPGPVVSIDAHPSGKVAISTSTDNSIRLWNLETGKPASRNRIQGFKALDHVRWSPCGSYYALVGDDRSVLVFSLESKTGAPLSTTKLDSRVNCISFLGENHLLVGLENGKLSCFPISKSAGLEGEKSISVDCGGRIRGVSSVVHGFIVDSEREKMGSFEGLAISALSSGEIAIWNLETKSKVVELQAGSGGHLTCLAVTGPRPQRESREEGKKEKKTTKKAETQEEILPETAKQREEKKTPKKQAIFEQKKKAVSEKKPPQKAKNGGATPSKAGSILKSKPQTSVKKKRPAPNQDLERSPPKSARKGRKSFGGKK